MKRLLLITIVVAIITVQGLAAAVNVQKYGKFEASFTLADQSGNPYDPLQNDVDVEFSGPANQRSVVPAFWDGDRWRVRFAPTQVGSYTLRIVRSGTVIADPADLTSSTFLCTPSIDPGFVRVDRKNPQHFVFDNGQPYYPQGIDVAWSGGAVPDYPTVLQYLGAAHMNWARIWMTFWDNKALDWASEKNNNPPIGQFSLNAARRWDTIFDAAAANGVYIQMTLQHHGQYTAQVDPNWSDNPFNAKNGGFLHRPDDFFTDQEARALTRAKYRYIVARWGYSTHLLGFELFNEVQNVKEAQSHFADVVAWHREMASAIRSVDIDRHLITTSMSDPGTPLARIGLDYDQIHVYTPDIISYFASLAASHSSAPVFVGEWGPPGDVAAMPATFLHDGIWSSTMAPVSGAGQFWYWDATLKQNYWRQFASATAFVRAYGIDARTGFEPAKLSVVTSGPSQDLVFNPPAGWSPTTRYETKVPCTGSMPDLSGMSYFIQGTNHRDMLSAPVKFDIDAPEACRFTAALASVSKAGGNLTLSVDNGGPTSADFPASKADYNTAQTLAVDIPPGHHTISLYNTGADWLTLKDLTITHYVPGVGVVARRNQNSVVFWAYNRDRSAKTLSSATVTFYGLPKGTATFHLWNTWSGDVIPAPAVIRQGDMAIVELPGFIKDVAGIVVVH